MTSSSTGPAGINPIAWRELEQTIKKLDEMGVTMVEILDALMLVTVSFGLTCPWMTANVFHQMITMIWDATLDQVEALREVILLEREGGNN